MDEKKDSENSNSRYEFDLDEEVDEAKVKRLLVDLAKLTKPLCPDGSLEIELRNKTAEEIDLILKHYKRQFF